MDRGQAEKAWEGMMSWCPSLIQTLAGRSLPQKIVAAPEPGPKDPRHSVVDFLHEWASALDEEPKFDADDAQKVVEAFGVAPTEEKTPKAATVIKTPEPVTVDGCPTYLLETIWINRVDPRTGRGVMNASELAFHMKVPTNTVYRMRSKGEFPMPMCWYMAPDHESRRFKHGGYYRDEVRKFLLTWAGGKRA